MLSDGQHARRRAVVGTKGVIRLWSSTEFRPGDHGDLCSLGGREALHQRFDRRIEVGEQLSMPIDLVTMRIESADCCGEHPPSKIGVNQIRDHQHLMLK